MSGFNWEQRKPSSIPQSVGEPTPIFESRPLMSRICPCPAKSRKVIPAPSRRQSSVAYPTLPRARLGLLSVTRTVSGTESEAGSYAALSMLTAAKLNSSER